MPDIQKAYNSDQVHDRAIQAETEYETHDTGL
jgi:hypothetical protein